VNAAHQNRIKRLFPLIGNDIGARIQETILQSLLPTLNIQTEEGARENLPPLCPQQQILSGITATGYIQY